MHPFWLAKTFWWWVSHPGTDRAKHCLTSVSTPPAALPLGHGARLCQPRSSSDTAAPTGDKRKKNRLSWVLLGELGGADLCHSRRRRHLWTNEKGGVGGSVWIPGAACTFWSLRHLRFLTAASRQVHFHAKARIPTRLQAHLVPWYLYKKMGTSRQPCPDCAKQGAMPSQTHLVGINLK